MPRLRWMASAVVIVALDLAGCTGAKDTAQPHVAKARELLANHDDAAALTELKAAVKADPRNKEARLLVANLMEQTGEIGAAYEDYARADALDPGDRTARFKLIDMLLAAGNLDAALGKISATLGDEPGNSKALGLRALVEARQGAVTKARMDSSNVLAKTPGQSEALAAMAELTLRDNKPDAAQGFVSQGLASDPTNTILLQIAARIALVQKAPERAVAIWRGLVDRQPMSSDARATLAELQVMTGSVADGVKTLDDGVAVAPRSRTMRLRLAAFLIQHSDAAAAERALRDAIVAMPNDGTFDLLLAGEQAGHGEVEAAIDTVKRAVVRVPESGKADLKVGLARLLIGKKDVEGAKQILNEVLAAHPSDDAALLIRADLRLRDGDNPADVLGDLLAVAKRQPTNTQVFELLTRTYLRLQQNDNAIDALRRLADLAPGDVAASLRVADLSTRFGRVADAKSAIDALIRRNPDSVAAQVAAIRFDLFRKDLAGASGGLARLTRILGAESTGLQMQAEIKEAAGDPGAAAALYRRLIEMATPGMELASTGYARAALQAGHGEEALTFLTSLAGSKTGGDAATFLLIEAKVAMALGKDAEAATAVASALRQAPTDTDAYRQAAAALWKAGQTDAALAQLDKGITAGADRASLLFAKATLQQMKGEVAAAIGSYRQILDTEPSAVNAANNLVSLMADQKPLDVTGLTKARDVLRGQTDFDNPAVIDSIAWADYRLGDFGAAKALFDRIKASDAGEPQIRFHYGAVLIATGAKEAGRQLIRTALAATFPARDEADMLLTQ